jgi:hypothetical protein
LADATQHGRADVDSEVELKISFKMVQHFFIKERKTSESGWISGAGKLA